jgi:hypothetical protein
MPYTVTFTCLAQAIYFLLMPFPLNPLLSRLGSGVRCSEKPHLSCSTIKCPSPVLPWDSHPTTSQLESHKITAVCLYQPPNVPMSWEQGLIFLFCIFSWGLDLVMMMFQKCWLNELITFLETFLFKMMKLLSIINHLKIHKPYKHISNFSKLLFSSIYNIHSMLYKYFNDWIAMSFLLLTVLYS